MIGKQNAIPKPKSQKHVYPLEAKSQYYRSSFEPCKTSWHHFLCHIFLTPCVFVVCPVLGIFALKLLLFFQQQTTFHITVKHPVHRLPIISDNLLFHHQDLQILRKFVEFVVCNLPKQCTFASTIPANQSISSTLIQGEICSQEKFRTIQRSKINAGKLNICFWCSHFLPRFQVDLQCHLCFWWPRSRFLFLHTCGFHFLFGLFRLGRCILSSQTLQCTIFASKLFKVQIS